ncbi:plasmid stabilization system [Planktothrix agardhii CCAP 1459/11A]|jgi:mRNA interferase YafQ|uniref:Addiction module toxin, RelE/StbE family n=3 Tax=Planktothrix TaxID=54304 RepID=A0A1J1JKJ8_PLAAG|nr:MULTISPECIES: type II toxin-antitoxin system mRNA interferase toxin, RelE/StbE family [Planktothrix]MCB8763203.1 type II toxin-antitoxin system mRNA interferase toxin, RelE/StbE family [Planktothrix agardhii 1809]MCB8776850.1 type II toxin-antitoxin system mRNA interferase toxin, RelE/StbE family [Planktothrix agardhii 1031]MCB8781283.1 type II toxin-antitoxin system mRNA interferase toxin, RelE/StbE family [Planktothrix agardhii 1808]MCF3567531.1 type II toxin-antitoxin system mRNA interfer
MKIVYENSFKRSFKRLVKKNPQLQEKVISVITLLSEDPFIPSLKTHKLKGNLDGLWSCSVAYDCRIIFDMETIDESTGEGILNLYYIGSHDEAYS